MFQVTPNDVFEDVLSTCTRPRRRLIKAGYSLVNSIRSPLNHHQIHGKKWVLMALTNITIDNHHAFFTGKSTISDWAIENIAKCNSHYQAG